jgi:hypothetical protein
MQFAILTQLLLHLIFRTPYTRILTASTLSLLPRHHHHHHLKAKAKAKTTAKAKRAGVDRILKELGAHVVAAVSLASIVVPQNDDKKLTYFPVKCITVS